MFLPKLGPREAEKKESEVFLGVVRRDSATSFRGDEFTSPTQEADVMHACVYSWWPGCGWVHANICQVHV